MHESTADVLRQLAGERASKGPEVDLRGRIWLGHVQHRAGVTDKEIGRAIYGTRSVSNLLEKWRTGSVSPSRQSALLIERNYPGSLWVFDLPLWALLKDTPVSRQVVEKYASPYIIDRLGLKMWWFPGDDQRLREKRAVGALIPTTAPLVSRNDHWGLVGTLLQVRLHEANRDLEQHLGASMDMIRAVPGALRQPWIRPYAEQLIACVDAIRRRSLFSTMLYDIDRELLLRQADDATYEPHREKRPIDPLTLRFVDHEDPVLHAQIVRRSVMAKQSVV